MGIPKSISQLLSPSSACDSPSSFSSSLPWLSSQNAHGSHLKRSQLKSRLKSRLKSQLKSLVKASKETGEEASETRKASGQTETSSHQLCKVDGSTYWWHLLVESGQQGLRHLYERWHAVRISYSEQMLQKASQSGLPRN